MIENSVPLLVVSGPVGVGKTTVGYEVTTLLERRGVRHTYIDFDVLTQTFPRPADDRFGNALGIQNLRDVWRNCAAAGSRNLILSYVIEEQRQIDQMVSVVHGAVPMVCQLSAQEPVLLDRVRGREIGVEVQWFVDRARELAASLPRSAPADITIDTTDRTITSVAEEIVTRVEWA